MEYTDVRCRTCGTWRTALVGYDGARVCLTCGETVQRRAGSSALTRFAAGDWTDAGWAPEAGASHARRGERLRGWLAGQSISLPEPYVEVLAHCERAVEVRFALPIVTLSTWYPVGERSFSDGHWTLRLQHPVLGRPVDFLLEGPGGSRPLVIEIDAPQPRREDRVRTLELQAARYQVLRVPAERAEERGTALRQAFMREALEVIESTPPVRLEPRGAGLPARARRIWSRHELVYDATGLPLDDRRELVEDWLRSRGEELEGWQLDFLAHCERAAEVHFAIPFLRLPSAEPVDSRTVHLDPWHTLTAQVPVDGYPVDFSFMTVLEPGGEVVTTLVEIHPARGARDRDAERRRALEWTARGHTVVEVAATEAAARAQRWVESLLGELRGRNAG